MLGFAVLTTAITYILSVLSAATNKTNLATFLSSMGETPRARYDYCTRQESARGRYHPLAAVAVPAD